MAKALYFRQGVYWDRFEDCIRKILPNLIKIYEDEAHQPFVLFTSTFESSEHRGDSFHYVNKAVDIKTPFNRFYLEDEQKSEKVFRELKDELGKDYDIVWHKGSHFHIEFDPK